MGFCLWGRTESDTTDATQQQQQQALVAACGLSLAAANRGSCLVWCSGFHCGGFSGCCAWTPECTGSGTHGLQYLGHMGSVGAAHRLQSAGSVVVHGLSSPMACGVFLDHGLSLTLAIRLFTSEPRGKSRVEYFGL